MNAKKILALLLGAMMLLALAACGAKDNDKQADMSGDSSAMTGEPKPPRRRSPCTRSCWSGKTRSCRKMPNSGRRCSWRPIRA